MKLAPRGGCGAARLLSIVNRATRFGVSTLGSVALPAPANDNGEAPQPTPELKWLNVANEGEYLGHHQGGFRLDATVMQQLVDNLHGHPQFKLGDVTINGETRQAGVADVVQFDYEHASEMAPWEGTIPLSGAPAIGWVRDLELRKDSQGRLQLWALAWLGTQIRGQIDRREYKWVSIAWNPQGVHWQTNEPCGAVLTSIAFTNHPFLQDLESIAAANRVAGQAPAGGVQPKSPSSGAHATGATSRSGERTLMELRTRLCSVYRLQPEANDDSIIRAAENAAAVGGTLAGLLSLLGVSDPDAATKVVPELTAARGRLVEMLAELDSLMSADATADAALAPTDVAAALSARGWAVRGTADPAMVSALTAHRKSLIDAEIGKLKPRTLTVNGQQQSLPPAAGDQRLARERGRQAFLAAYGVNTNPATQHLTQTFVAGPGPAGGHQQYPVPGAVQPLQLGGLPLPIAPDARPPLQLSQPGQQPVAPMQPVDLSAFSGRNTTERVIAYLSSVDQGFTKLSWGEKVRRAGTWRREYEQQNGPLAA